MFNFKILKKSTKSRARLGLLETEHGVVETPAFVPVATQAVIKTLTSEEVVAVGSQILIANTFHLHLKPGENIVDAGGLTGKGLHGFMNWQKPLMTDSGGFQVFSLGFGRDQKVGKISKTPLTETLTLGQQPSNVKITETGVYFNSPVDGKRLFIGPKESIKIQQKLGADIVFAFDECTPPTADYEYTKKSLEKTHRWAQECLNINNYKNKTQALYGIVQGGKFKDLRIQSAKFIGALPFDGFGIGGEFGDNKDIMVKTIRQVTAELPDAKPRHLLGIGHPDDFVKIIREGIDTFDCIAPTHYARRGIAFTSGGRVDLNRTEYLMKKISLDKKCDCFVCKNYSVSYICHLLRAKEITPLKLLTFHNLYYFNNCIAQLRLKIKDGII